MRGMRLHRIFFYLTLILLPTQLGYHFFPDWALVIGRRLDYLAPTLFLTDITICCTLAFWLIQLFKSHRSNPKSEIRNPKQYLKSKKLNSNFLLLISLSLCLFISLNICLATSPLIACFKWLKLFEFGLFGFYIIKTKPSFSRSLWCLSVAMFYSSLIAITQFFLKHSIGGIFWFLGERTFDVTTLGIARIQLLPFFLSPYLPISSSSSSELLRPYATFPHPNVLGGFLAITLPLIITSSNFSLSFRPTSRNPFLKTLGFLIRSGMTHNWFSFFRILTIILGIIALILTFSRSAWLAFAALFILLKITCPPKPRRRQEHFKFIKNFKLKIKNFYLLVLLIILVAFSLPYFQTLTSNNESVYVRNELNSAAISMWRSSSSNTSLISFLLPRLFGVGLGNYLVELPKYYPHRDIFFLQPVHNIYLLIFAETGIIGLSVFFFLLWKIATKPHKDNFSFYLLVSLSLYLLLGLVDHYPLTLQQGQLLLTILIALSIL